MNTTPEPLLPPDEAERLRTLRYYDIVDSLHEQVFNEFVVLTAHIFSLPISLISLVEEDTVYYKANHGMPGHSSEPRAEALCSIAVQQNAAVVFTDLAQPQPIRLTPEAEAATRIKGLRFYAAAPLRMPDARSIGTLCVIDRQPRSFSADEQQMLDQLAALVARTIAVRHYCLATDALGEARWESVRTEVIEEVQALVALVRYLITRSGVQIPVSEAVLEPVAKRLTDLWTVLAEYRQG